MSRRDNGARRIAGSSLKFIVVGVFVNGKMAVSLTGDLDSIEGVLVEAERREAGRGTSSGKSSDAATGGDICINGMGGDLDLIDGVLMEGE